MKLKIVSSKMIFIFEDVTDFHSRVTEVSARFQFNGKIVGSKEESGFCEVVIDKEEFIFAIHAKEVE